MKDMIKLIGFVMLFVAAIIMFVVGFGMFGRYLEIATDRVPIVVKVGERVVYTGLSYGVETESNGATTKVTILGGPMYMFPKAYYVGNNIVIDGKR